MWMKYFTISRKQRNIVLASYWVPSQDKGFSSQEASFLGLPSDIQLVLKSKSYLRQGRKYLRCDPWRAGRVQESGPVGRQLFIPGRWCHGDNMISWYLPDWQVTYPKREADWDIWKIYTLMFCAQNKSNQIYLHKKCLQFAMLHIIWTSWSAT